MKASLYMETTVPSYYSAQPSRNLVVTAHQQIIREWWRRRLQDLDVCISQFVLDEAGRGRVLEARKRLALLVPFKLLDANAEALALAKSLVAAGCIPAKAGVDAAHIAVASVHHMHFLLTWNCKHIANAELADRIAEHCYQKGYACPVICTPEELLGG